MLIASPEHWHHDHLIDAVRAGKDAYCEKPMSWSIEQGVNMIKEVRKTDRIVQIGMQRRSSPLVHEAKAIMDEGLIGEINIVRAEWYWNMNLNRDPNPPGKVDWEAFQGPAPRKAFDPIRFRSWRYFWDFSGGNMTDQGTHLLDVIQWFKGDATDRGPDLRRCLQAAAGRDAGHVLCDFRVPKVYLHLDARLY